MRQRLIASWVPGEDGIPTVMAQGEIDISTAPLLDEVLCEARTKDPFAIVVSLEACTYCDSIGLGVLLRHARVAPRFIVVSPDESQIRRLLRISRVDEKLEVVSSLRLARALQSATH